MLNEYTFNLAECGLWQLVALALALKSVRSPVATRRVLRFLALTFCLFGASDYIEAQTGAWWTPWWLLVLKGSCVIALVGGFWLYYSLQRSEKQESDQKA